MPTIDEVRSLVKAGRVKWTAHVMERLQERGIQPSDVTACLLNGEVIEDYPDDNPYPSCLVYGDNLHTVVGVGDDILFMITAYSPDGVKWLEDLRTRRKGESR